MIYRVTYPSNPALDGQHGRFLVSDDTDIIRSVYVDGDVMIPSLATFFVPEGNYKFRGRMWREVAEQLRAAGYVIEERGEKEEKAPDNKVALWCRLYKEYKGVAYKVSGADAGKMKRLNVTEELLRWYLDEAKLPQNSTTWLWRGKQSIGNLSHYWNEVNTARTTPAASKHPNTYDRDYERKLTGEGITEYRKHLRSLGLVPVTDRSGAITTYRKPDASTH